MLHFTSTFHSHRLKSSRNTQKQQQRKKIGGAFSYTLSHLSVGSMFTFLCGEVFSRHFCSSTSLNDIKTLDSIFHLPRFKNTKIALANQISGMLQTWRWCCLLAFTQIFSVKYHIIEKNMERKTWKKCNRNLVESATERNSICKYGRIYFFGGSEIEREKIFKWMREISGSIYDTIWMVCRAWAAAIRLWIQIWDCRTDGTKKSSRKMCYVFLIGRK